MKCLFVPLLTCVYRDDSDFSDLEPVGGLRRGNALRTIEDTSRVYKDDGLFTAVVLVGPCGVGKTAAVYACATALGFQVVTETVVVGLYCLLLPNGPQCLVVVGS